MLKLNTPKIRMFSSVVSRRATMALAFLLLLLGGVATAYKEEVNMDGDVVVGGLFAVQDHEGDSCSEVNPSSIQEFQAVRWFFSQLNHRNYINNVTIGFHSFKTCGLVSGAVRNSLRLIGYKNKTLFGLIGPYTSSATQTVSRLLSSLPEQDRLPQIVYSATATTLSDRDIYKNLFRVIVPDDVQVDIMLKLLLSLKWNYIAIVYDNDVYGTEASQALKELVEKHDICVPVFTAIDSSSETYDPTESFRSVGSDVEGRGQRERSPIIGIVFIGQARTAADMFKYLDVKQIRLQMIVSETIRASEKYLKDGSEVYKRAKGLLTSSPHLYNVEQFQQYWTSLHTNATAMMKAIENNDWLKTYMEEITGCSLVSSPTIPCLEKSTAYIEDQQISLFVGYALLAAASFAKSFKTVYEQICPSQIGLCEDLTNLPDRDTYFNALQTIRIDPETDFEELIGIRQTFGFVKGEIDITAENENYSSYSIYNYRKESDSADRFSFVKVADFVKGELNLTLNEVRSYSKSGEEGTGAVEAQCQETYECLSCKTEPVYGDVLFIPGDYYVVGLTPIHNRGDNLYKCGELRKTVSVDIAEGFSFAVKTINSKEGIFNSTSGEMKVGLVLMDTCNTAFLTRERVTKFLRGEIRLSEQLTSSHILDKVIGFVGPYSSSNSIALSLIMTETNFLYISYSATSTRLSDRINFPTYMRTCAPDSSQANVIMKLASSIDAKYVQIIHTDGEYGVAGKNALVEAAKKYKVCVAQTLIVTDTTDASKLQGYVSDLRKFRHAKMVIIFARSHVANVFLSALNDEIEMNEFVFIGGESWGKREEVLVDNPKLRGSLTLAQELPLTEGFEEYFTNINIEETENPWLQEFLELRFNCYLPMSFHKTHGSLCQPNVINETKVFDTWIPFAINGVYSLVLGFQKGLQTICPGSSTICPEYTTEELIRHTMEVQLDIYRTGEVVRVFDDNGEGLVGYRISHVVREGDKLVYKEVASSEDEFSLDSLDVSERLDYASQCPHQVECDVCEQQFNPSFLPKQEDNTTIIGLGVGIGVLAALMGVVCVVMFCCFRQKKMKNIDDPYLTVVPDKDEDYASPPVPVEVMETNLSSNYM